MKHLIPLFALAAFLGCEDDDKGPSVDFTSDLAPDIVSRLESGTLPAQNTGQALREVNTTAFEVYTRSAFDQYRLDADTLGLMTESCHERVRLTVEGSPYTYVASTADGEINGATYLRLGSVYGDGEMWFKVKTSASVRPVTLTTTDGRNVVNAVRLSGEIQHPVPSYANLSARLDLWAEDPCQ